MLILMFSIGRAARGLTQDSGSTRVPRRKVFLSVIFILTQYTLQITVHHITPYNDAVFLWVCETHMVLDVNKMIEMRKDVKRS